MTTAGIIAEYNPFHNGHKFHIEETKRKTGADCIVVVMSGNFVQRGEPAVFNKWVRAEAAIRNGADLVVELPVVYSCSGAEFFAGGAARVLCAPGVVDYISFGAEAGSLDRLREAAEFFDDESRALSENIKKNLKAGMSYAAARSRAAAESGMGEYAEIVSEPNNILAVEYIKQLNRLDKSGWSVPKAVVIKRKSAGYYEQNPDEGIAGAGKLRDLMRDGVDINGYLPQSIEEAPCFSEQAFELIVYRLLTDGAEKISQIDGVIEGLENRAIRAAKEAIDMESLINLIKSKRYSRTSIQRMLMKILLGISKSDMKDFEKIDRVYLRVLGFSGKGAELIRRIKKQDRSDVTVITNINRQRLADPITRRMLEYDIRASEIYDLINYARAGVNSDYRMRPFMADTGKTTF